MKKTILILIIVLLPVIVPAADYSLKSGSPAIDAGAPIFTYADYPGDFDGKPVYGSAPDIGAHEYVSKKSLFPVFPITVSVPIECESTDTNCYLAE